MDFQPEKGSQTEVIKINSFLYGQRTRGRGQNVKGPQPRR